MKNNNRLFTRKVNNASNAPLKQSDWGFGWGYGNFRPALSDLYFYQTFWPGIIAKSRHFMLWCSMSFVRNNCTNCHLFLKDNLTFDPCWYFFKVTSQSLSKFTKSVWIKTASTLKCSAITDKQVLSPDPKSPVNNTNKLVLAVSVLQNHKICKIIEVISDLGRCAPRKLFTRKLNC